MQDLNLACDTLASAAGRYLGPCGPRKLPRHECCRVLLYYLWYVLVQGMRKIDPHRHAARQGILWPLTLPRSPAALQGVTVAQTESASP
jgi:hypothetical protein